MAKVIWKCCRIGWALLKVWADVRKCQAKWQEKVHPLFISCNDGCFVWNHWNDANRAIFFNVSQQSLPTLWCSKGHPTDKIWFMLFLIYICVFVYLAYETFLNIFAISLPMQYLCALSMHSRQIFTYYMSSHSVQFLKHLKYIRLVQHQKHFKKQHQQNIKLVWPIIQS